MLGDLYAWRESTKACFQGNDGHRGRMSDVSSTLHQSDIPCSKGDKLFIGRTKESRQVEHP
jgi:hypothetical protein